jgi:hypothetical protein
MAKSFNSLKAQMPVEIRMEVDERIKQEMLKIALQQTITNYNHKLYKNKVNFIIEPTKSELSTDRLSECMILWKNFCTILPYIIRNEKFKIIF